MPAIDLGSYDWHTNVAEVINSIGHHRLPSALVRAVSHLVPFEHLAMMRFDAGRSPTDLLASYIDRRYHATYFAGNYRHDPFYQAVRRRRAHGLFRMGELTPDLSRYLDRYEMGPRIGDVVARHRPVRAADLGSGEDLREEIGFLMPLDGGAVAHLALIRSKRLPAFSDEELARLRAIEPVVRTVVRRHWPAAGSLEETGLTPRELEVAEHILAGCSPTAIAMRLGISVGTVKVHRRHIYRKLGLSSQAELFTRYLRPGRGPA